MPKRKGELIWSECSECRGKRAHTVLRVFLVHDQEGHSADTYYILRCRGCRTIGFRQDYELEAAGDYIEEGNFGYHDWGIRTSTVYPKMGRGGLTADELYFVPRIVEKVYEETLIAIQEGIAILSGMGLRGVLEAICLEREINGDDLMQKITKLKNKGFVSEQDWERLHAIRFLGNDAAHEIEAPESTQIDVALKIIEHALRTIYILRAEAEGKLETAVNDISALIKLLTSSLEESDLQVGEEYSLQELLGGGYRRAAMTQKDLEKELIKKIETGSVELLEKGGKRAVGQGDSQTQLQLFKLVKKP